MSNNFTDAIISYFSICKLNTDKQNLYFNLTRLNSTHKGKFIIIISITRYMCRPAADIQSDFI